MPLIIPFQLLTTFFTLPLIMYSAFGSQRWGIFQYPGDLLFSRWEEGIVNLPDCSRRSKRVRRGRSTEAPSDDDILSDGDRNRFDGGLNAKNT